MSKRAAIYLRVSTDGQTTDNQRLELEQVVSKAGWTLVTVFEDAGISGAKGRAGRPAFDKMLTQATQRKFDVVMVWAVDRLGRSLADLVSCLSDLHGAGVDLYIHQQGIDTTTPSGKAMFQMLGVFAEFERSMIRERVQAGLARAKAQGKVLGRKPVGPDIQRAAQAQRDKGVSVRKIAKHLAVSVGWVSENTTPPEGTNV